MMKCVTFLLIVFLNNIYSQEYTDTISKFKYNSIGIATAFNYTKDGSEYLSENSISLFAKINDYYLSLGCSYTNKLNESSRYEKPEINLAGLTINFGRDFYNYKNLITIPVYLYYNYYNHIFVDKGGLNSQLILSTKGFKMGVQFNINKIHLNSFINIGLNYLKRIDKYTEPSGMKHRSISVGLLPSLELGLKYNLFTKNKN